MINEHQDLATFMTLQYDCMYLHLCDDTEPLQDILIEGITPTLEEAQEFIVTNLDKWLIKEILITYKKHPLI